MAVACSLEPSPITQDDFHAADRVVMRHVFDIHNAVGRFCDEKVYQEELARRCAESGFTVDREVALQASHRSFSKTYYMDMLVNKSAVYELKTVEALNGSHEKQLINYLLLAGLSHGKLINFRAGSVESHFVSTRLRPQDRATFRINDSGWQGEDEVSRLLKDSLHQMFEEWGTFLDKNLYRDALLHLIEAPEAGIRSVDIEVSGRVVGSQKMCTLNGNTAWHMSAVRTHKNSYETHVVRLLNHTRLESIHWINLDQRCITLKTLKK